MFRIRGRGPRLESHWGRFFWIRKICFSGVGWRTKLKPYCLLQHVAINNFFERFLMFFSWFQAKITKKRLKWRKKVENSSKKYFNQLFGCVQHPKAGRNTQHPLPLRNQSPCSFCNSIHYDVATQLLRKSINGVYRLEWIVIIDISRLEKNGSINGHYQTIFIDHSINKNRG